MPNRSAKKKSLIQPGKRRQVNVTKEGKSQQSTSAMQTRASPRTRKVTGLTFTKTLLKHLQTVKNSGGFFITSKRQGCQPKRQFFIAATQQHTALNRYQRDEERRLLLIGKTGSGKSTLGNAILGSKMFVTEGLPMKSITKQCQFGTVCIGPKKFCVVDTPGFMDTNQKSAKIDQELLNYCILLAPGPHAVCLTIRADVRFTEEESKALERFYTFFGEEIFSYLIVIFTHRAELEKHQKTAEDCLSILPMGFRTKYQKYGCHCIAIEADDTRNIKKQVKELLELVEEVFSKNNGKFYTDEHMKEAEEALRSRIPRIKDAVNKSFEKKKSVLERTIPVKMPVSMRQKIIRQKEKEKEKVVAGLNKCNKKVDTLEKKFKQQDCEKEKLKKQLKVLTEKMEEIVKKKIIEDREKVKEKMTEKGWFAKAVGKSLKKIGMKAVKSLSKEFWKYLGRKISRLWTE